MSPQGLFVAAVVLGVLSIATLISGAVRLVVGRLRTSAHPIAQPKGVIWPRLVILIGWALIGLCIAALVAFYAFYWGCTRGPDAC
jgi:hypothetical protein